MSSCLLQTERLLLRPWEERDREPFAALNADAEVMEYLAKVLSREESDAYIEVARAHFTRYGYGLWAVEERASGAFVGLVGLRWVPYEAHFTPAVEVAWRIHRRFWGQGLATEAAAASLRYGFEQVGLSEIVALTLPVNRRSQRVMEKIGMQRNVADDFEHPLLPEGHPKRSHILYRISAEHWQEQRCK